MPRARRPPARLDAAWWNLSPRDRPPTETIQSTIIKRRDGTQVRQNIRIARDAGTVTFRFRSEKEQNTAISLLGFEPIAQLSSEEPSDSAQLRRIIDVLRAIRSITERYRAFRDHQVSIRPVHLLLQLDPLERRARKSLCTVEQLQKEMRNLSDPAVMYLLEHRVINARLELLPDHARQLGRAVDDLRWKDSRQAPANTAFRSLVYQLAALFCAYYREDDAHKDFRAFTSIIVTTLKIPVSAPTLRTVCRETLKEAAREAKFALPA